ncbi:hypothetical protein EZV62_005502 [Acer yangbiense]|uniref:F-box associated beta-propeller type 3 domain-containing protein n=1 Tax=Acer yangbiense TaxID=1000413 RepID=A0A5C7IMF2_9ROSI|nr:hypothetical protein EZV62_005502 [Acer yangbiense]
MYNRSRIQQYDFINLTSSDPSDPPFQSLTFLDNRIVQSCHGLMLLHSNSGRYERSDNYCVYNPTTRQCLILPPFPVNEVFNAICGINLAYDPSKSPHYKVICVRGCENLEEGDFQIEIYSSKIGFWRKSRSSGIFTAHYETNFGIGTFWNGALHWISPCDGSLYFDVDEEKVHDLPMPAIHADFRRRFRYFGESRDHLHLIEIYGPCTALFNVYEMERDYSGWMIKYRVDLLSIAAAFPEMVRSYRDPLMEYLCYYGFSILSIVREEEDEDSYLVVHIPNKAIRYNFKDKSFGRFMNLLRLVSKLKSRAHLNINGVMLFNTLKVLHMFDHVSVDQKSVQFIIVGYCYLLAT